jgi:hypothetical protein
MQITINATKYRLDPETEAIVEEKLVAPLRLLGKESDRGLLEIEVEEAPPHGRSSEPYHLIARLKVDGQVYYAEATKPSPESAADKVRSELEAEIRKTRGRAHRLLRRGGIALKNMLRFDR